MKSLTLILTALIWGAAFVAQSVGMDYLGPFTFNAARFFIGGLVLLPVIPLLDRLGGHAPDKGPAARRALVRGGLLCGLALGAASTAQQFGVQYTTVGKAGFITALYIVLVPLLGAFVGRRPAGRIWGSVALAVVGLYLLCMEGSFRLGLGDLLVLGCSVLFAVHILIIDRFSPLVDGVRLSCLQFFVAAAVSAVGMLAFEQPTLPALTAAWAPVLYAGVLSSGVGYTLQVVGQKGMDPTVASLLLSLESVFSVLAGWVLLHQSMSGRERGGGALMGAGILLAQLPARRAKTA